MLKRRIIPCLDVRDGRIVKGVNFVDLVDAGDPVAAAAAYDAAGADELCFLDITASHENRKTLYETVERTAAQCFMPLTVGGGVREISDIRRLLLSGADKVAINSAAVAQPEFIAKASEKFGRQCITIAIDARRRERYAQEERLAQEGRLAKYMSDFEIFTHGGRRASGRDALEFSLQAEALGAGELLVTSMDRDGTKLGYDLELTRLIADAVAIPVIASGGAGCLQHLTDAVRHGHASAVLAASIFHFGVYSIDEAKSAMHEAGIPVRRIRG